MNPTPTRRTTSSRHTTGARRRAATLVVTALAALPACAADGADDAVPPSGVVVDVTDPTADEPADTVAEPTDIAALPDLAPAPAAGVLEPEEVAGLLWMREEEQLAHDVYVALGDTWGLRVFENIATSEQQHIDATVGLLDQYGIDDPAVGNETGTFTDARMQELYDELMSQGVESEIAALTVGATIEELDIADLRERADATDEDAIDRVYEALERASRNHLRAFVGQLELLGVEYEATVLADLADIVDSPMERGGDH